ncbi:MAG TPA: prephenate dehydratase domain-containing protein, partial [Longimicrobiales bacterium]|nr:prephenate dehydratase domain-containing protein [Longimicrobiales bacterium]
RSAPSGSRGPADPGGSVTRGSEGGRRVGFQGALGAFSEEAVRVLVPGAEPVPRATFEGVVRGVERGEEDAGVVPVENTLAGAVAEAYDALEAGAVTVVGEVAIPIRHCLLGVPGATVEGLREARSHPVALSQCRGFFAAHPAVRAQAVYDTAGAAQEVAAAGDRGVAAIASRAAGERYGLEVLRADLQDRDDNQTRFYLVVRDGEPAPDSERAAGVLKTACVFELENRPGALHELLGVFAGRGLDLTHVASRPAASPWTYRFILEFLHGSAPAARPALEEAGALAARMRVLGTFAAWRPGALPGPASSRRP